MSKKQVNQESKGHGCLNAIGGVIIFLVIGNLLISYKNNFLESSLETYIIVDTVLGILTGICIFNARKVFLLFIGISVSLDFAFHEKLSVLYKMAPDQILGLIILLNALLLLATLLFWKRMDW